MVSEKGKHVVNSPDQRDPFVQLVFVSIPVAIAGAFIAAIGFEILAPELRSALFVPFGAAFFCGTLAFLVERAREQHLLAVLVFFVAIVLFPGLAWGMLLILNIPYQTTIADSVALLPQAIMAPTFFFFFRRRFENRDLS